MNYSRNTDAYKEWRRAVIKKNGSKCQKCGSLKTLHVHHIRTWALYPELRFKVDNGLVVCKKCHIEIHPYMVKYDKNKIKNDKKRQKSKKERKKEKRLSRLERVKKREDRFSVNKYKKLIDYSGMPKRGSCKP